MHKVNILIAEDDSDDFQLLKEAIEDVLPKFNITHVRDGRQFVKMINAGIEPDIIFLDLHIPFTSGIGCLREFRKQQHLLLTPVIIYSTSSNFEDIDTCYKNGCTLYMVKPSSFRDLITQIKKVFFRLGLPKNELLDREMFVVKKQNE